MPRSTLLHIRHGNEHSSQTLGPMVPEQGRGQFQELCRDEIRTCDTQLPDCATPLGHVSLRDGCLDFLAPTLPLQARRQAVYLPLCSYHHSQDPGNRTQSNSLFSYPKVNSSLFGICSARNERKKAPFFVPTPLFIFKIQNHKIFEMEKIYCKNRSIVKVKRKLHKNRDSVLFNTRIPRFIALHFVFFNKLTVKTLPRKKGDNLLKAQAMVSIFQ